VQVDFWLRNLRELSQALGAEHPTADAHCRPLGSGTGGAAGLCRQLNVDAVHFNEEYGVHESRAMPRWPRP
jgi:deoxyribodipyrimidine photo-lyase